MGQGSLLYIIVLIAVFYFLMIRPQQQQQKKRMEMMNNMQPGAKIITIGGICGTLVKATDDRIFIEVAEGVVIEMLRTAVSTVVTESDVVAEEADEEDDLDDIDLDDIDLEDIDLDDEDLYYEEEDKPAK